MTFQIFGLSLINRTLNARLYIDCYLRLGVLGFTRLPDKQQGSKQD
jgi:hypothetical protein